MKNILMTVDAGNTNISLALMQGDEVIGRFMLMTKTPRTSDEYGIFFKQFIESCNVSVEDVSHVMISSVVPKIMYSLTSAIRKYIRVQPIEIGPGIKTGIEVRTDNPKEVGADRIVNVAAAYHTYHRSCIVVDFGTATTFDYVNKNGVFEYTVIAPGLGISAQALTSQTAKLPEIEIKKPDSILGKNTISGMQAGIVYGYIGLVEYIVKQMRKELHDEDCYVIATGGLGRSLFNDIDIIDHYDKDLAARGMKIIFDRNCK